MSIVVDDQLSGLVLVVERRAVCLSRLNKVADQFFAVEEGPGNGVSDVQRLHFPRDPALGEPFDGFAGVVYESPGNVWVGPSLGLLHNVVVELVCSVIIDRELVPVLRKVGVGGRNAERLAEPGVSTPVLFRRLLQNANVVAELGQSVRRGETGNTTTYHDNIMVINDFHRHLHRINSGYISVSSSSRSR